MVQSKRNLFKLLNSEAYTKRKILEHPHSGRESWKAPRKFLKEAKQSISCAFFSKKKIMGSLNILMKNHLFFTQKRASMKSQNRRWFGILTDVLAEKKGVKLGSKEMQRISPTLFFNSSNYILHWFYLLIIFVVFAPSHNFFW